MSVHGTVLVTLCDIWDELAEIANREDRTVSKLCAILVKDGLRRLEAHETTVGEMAARLYDNDHPVGHRKMTHSQAA